MLKGLKFLIVFFLFPAVTMAYSINWTVFDMRVDMFDCNVWDGSLVSRKMILDKLDFLEDGDKDNERLAAYTSESFVTLVDEAKGLLTASSRKNPAFDAFVNECESIHGTDDDKIQKSIHIVLEKMVKEAKNKLEWQDKVDSLVTAKPAIEDPSVAAAQKPVKGVAKRSHGADSVTNGHGGGTATSKEVIVAGV